MIFVRLTEDPIDTTRLIGMVGSNGCGATTLFLGTVRDSDDGREVKGIAYSAYGAMAEQELLRIAREAEQRFGVAHLAIEHRLGHLEIGELSVAIAVSHAHRTPALEAQRYVIEELKARVPIWKKELYTDGTREWVDPTRANSTVWP
jgi:molybdopterin synthase catalytic subunit